MSEALRDFLIKLKAIGIVILIGFILSYFFYSVKRKDLFGGFIGGLVVAFIGALIGGYLLDYFFYDISVKILEFLSRGAGVNVIAGFIGGYFALYVMNRLNHNKERKKY